MIKIKTAQDKIDYLLGCGYKKSKGGTFLFKEIKFTTHMFRVDVKNLDMRVMVDVHNHGIVHKEAFNWQLIEQNVNTTTKGIQND